VGRLTLLYHIIHGLVHTAGLGEATSMINFIFMVYICAQLNSVIKRQDRAFAQCKAQQIALYCWNCWPLQQELKSFKSLFI